MKIAFAAFIFMASLTQTMVLADGNTGIVRGVVRHHDSEKPIKNIFVIWANPSGTGTAKTDASGRFYFFDVPPGVTYIGLSGSGLNASCLEGLVHANETVDVSVHLDPSTRGQLASRCPALHASGREAVEDSL